MAGLLGALNYLMNWNVTLRTESGPIENNKLILEDDTGFLLLEDGSFLLLE